MSSEELEAGVLVATRGNHGLAMAWAGRFFHVPCTVVVPEGNNPEINRIVESFGADLIVHGHDFYDAQSYCDELVDSAGYYYVEQGNEPEILNGLGTMGLEIFEDLPEVDVIICPIGGGSGCASLVKVAQAVNPAVEIIGVQPERAAAFYESWQKGERVRLETADTVADGLAARSVFQLPFAIMKDSITDVVLLSEDEILQGIRLAIETTHNLAEGAGAASLAAALKIKDRLAGKKVALVMSGGNLDHEHLLQAMA
jgi:threonine dehydratase